VTRLERLDHRFVDRIPADLEPGVVYITIEYATAVHSCACGCRARVVTPFTPRHWELRFDGETVSLSPSIGNWSFACQSHYWIRWNRIEWAPRWSAAQIGRGQRTRPCDKYPDPRDTAGEQRQGAGDQPAR